MSQPEQPLCEADKQFFAELDRRAESAFKRQERGARFGNMLLKVCEDFGTSIAGMFVITGISREERE